MVHLLGSVNFGGLVTDVDVYSNTERYRPIVCYY